MPDIGESTAATAARGLDVIAEKLVDRLAARTSAGHISSAEELADMAPNSHGVRRIEAAIEAHREAGAAIVAAAEGRALHASEARALERHRDEMDALAELAHEKGEPARRQQDTAAAFQRLMEQPATRAGSDGRPRHPLAFTSQSLTNLQAALDSRTAGRFAADDVETRAALITTTFGSPRAWGSNVLSGPRLLSTVAGVPTQTVDAVSAQLPTLTIPSAIAPVAENITLAEFAASTAGSVSLQRYGRWTDASRESSIGTSADAIVAMHQVAIAKDLDLALINMVEAAAGAAVAFNADVAGAVRSAMATVIDNTAAADASDLVILVNPANAALLQDVSPTGGSTIAEPFQQFSGARVYPSSAVNVGFATVANLRAGTRYFEAQGLLVETDLAIKTSTLTVASSTIAGYGLALAGFAVMQDIVTP